MATNTVRTAVDEATAALSALADAEREMANWRAHLIRIVNAPTPAGAMQARRSALIVAGVTAEAANRTNEAARLVR